MSSSYTEAAGQLPANPELWQKFMLHEDRLTNIMDPPEADDMASAEPQKTADVLTDEEQNETVRNLHFQRNLYG